MKLRSFRFESDEVELILTSHLPMGSRIFTAATPTCTYFNRLVGAKKSTSNPFMGTARAFPSQKMNLRAEKLGF